MAMESKQHINQLPESLCVIKRKATTVINMPTHTQL